MGFHACPPKQNVSRETFAKADETIAAIATPLGEGGVGVVRISGPNSGKIFRQIFRIKKGKISLISHKATLGEIFHKGQKLDQAIGLYFKSPNSYTGEDVVEISGHGGSAVMRSILKAVLDAGARLADRGEFTRRAFLNGKIDLSQAEAVLDLIKARTRIGASVAISQLEGRLSSEVRVIRSSLIEILSEIEAQVEFSDDIPLSDRKKTLTRIKKINARLELILATAPAGKMLRSGIRAAIIGRPNVGKSCLMNAFLKDPRVIVTDEPGTTRDIIEETINLFGVPFNIIDTAGLRTAKGKAEGQGVLKAQNEIKRANLIIIVFDGSEPLKLADKRILKSTSGRDRIFVINKSDKLQKLNKKTFPVKETAFKISALKGTGIAALEKGLAKLSGIKKILPDRNILTNERHEECLKRAGEGLQRTIAALKKTTPFDLVAIDLKDAIIALGEVSGEEVSEEIINRIFEKFCVGK